MAIIFTLMSGVFGFLGFCATLLIWDASLLLACGAYFAIGVATLLCGIMLQLRPALPHPDPRTA